MSALRRLVTLIVVAALAAVAAGPASADEGYTLRDLGFIGGSTSDFMSQALGLNNGGVVVGQTRTPSALDAFAWYGAPPMFELPIFGSSLSQSLDVSDTGDVVGWYSAGADVLRPARVLQLRGEHARSEPDRGGDEPGDGRQRLARGVGRYGTGAPGAVRAFSSDGGAPPQDLATLGGTVGAAHDIDDAGTIVGYASTASGDVRAAIWSSPSAAPFNLGVLSPVTTAGR